MGSELRVLSIGGGRVKADSVHSMVMYYVMKAFNERYGVSLVDMEPGGFRFSGAQCRGGECTEAFEGDVLFSFFGSPKVPVHVRGGYTYRTAGENMVEIEEVMFEFSARELREALKHSPAGNFIEA